MPLSEDRALIAHAIALAEADGLQMTFGTFGDGRSVDPLGAVARTVDGHVKKGAYFCARSALGWTADQMWAFIAGYDLWPSMTYRDPRAIEHPGHAALGFEMRQEHYPRGR